MLSFCRKHTLEETGVFNGMTDWHSHILPGVDDGFKSIGDSLSVLEQYGLAGIREVWLTPHIMEDVPNTTENLLLRFEELREAWHGEVQLHLAAEYMVDTLFEERLDSGDLLPLGREGRHLLVETSYYNPPARMLAVLSEIKSKGYFPVLAHPERYEYMDMRYYALMSDTGVRFQLNLGSLAGIYGRHIQKKALHLLHNGYYDIIGTDLHRTAQLRLLLETPCANRSICRILASGKFMNI